MLSEFEEQRRRLQKPRPRALEKEDDDREWKKIDERESRKVKRRSKGRCEVTVRGRRCERRAFEIHHQKGGWKLRGRGDSALAKYKTHCCSDCHRGITGNVLKHAGDGGNRYERVD